MTAEEKIKETVFKHISPEENKVFLFGSRATGTNRKWSDYDIGVIGKEKLPYSKFNELKNELEESNIPYKIDIIDFAQVSDKFRNVALKNTKVWTRN